MTKAFAASKPKTRLNRVKIVPAIVPCPIPDWLVTITAWPSLFACQISPSTEPFSTTAAGSVR